jgi:predicted lipoprotein with Yx(FWY)xxD motif
VRTTMIRRGVAALGLLVLAGCGSSGNGGSSSSSTSSSSSGGGTSNAVLTTESSDLGTIVVAAADDRTVYVFDLDTPNSGKSACTGVCAEQWPAVPADSGSPAGDGLSGKVGTITRDDGTTQVTLAGLPLYTFSGDSQAGDVSGQGFGGIWWVVGPDGKKITAAAKSSSSAPSSAVSTGSGY